MTLLRSLGAVASASSESAVDWSAVASAATSATAPGDLVVDDRRRAALAADVRAATDRITTVSGLDAAGPDAIEVQHRHHWIEANVETFRHALAPLAERPRHLPELAARMNTAAMATTLALLSRHVLGQYDPPLFRAGPPRLVLVGPNVDRAADSLAVDPDRFRRWIVFHEVVHAVEFEAAPWLVDDLEGRIHRAVERLADGEVDAAALREVDLVMTAVEGYAEFLMDRAFDGPVTDLREALDARRRAGGPLARLVRRLLGLGVKRRQYERGRAFFETVAAERGVAAAAAVWDGPESLPTRPELETPADWLARVDP